MLFFGKIKDSFKSVDVADAEMVSGVGDEMVSGAEVGFCSLFVLL